MPAPAKTPSTTSRRSAAASKTAVKKAAPAKRAAPASKAARKVAAKPVPAAGKPASIAKTPEVPANALTKALAKTVTPKAAKVKLVRDSFTMPADEYAVIGELKQRALSFAHAAKKSELLRAGIRLLASLEDSALSQALRDVPAVKTGRPKSKKSD